MLDPVTGDLSDTRTRYLGSRPVKLFRVRMQGQEAVSGARGATPIPRTAAPLSSLVGRDPLGEGGKQKHLVMELPASQAPLFLSLLPTLLGN